MEAAIETDLRSLANEAKRKFANLKDGAEKAISALRQSEEFPLEDILRAVDLVRHTENSKIKTAGLAVLQRLLVYGLVDSFSLMQVLSLLSALATETQEEVIQLKTLQTLMLVLNPQSIILTDELVDGILDTCFKLHKAKTAPVKNTATATVLQLVSLTFDKLSSCIAEEGIQEESKGALFSSFESTAVYENSLKIFRSMTELAAGTKADWLADSVTARYEGLENLETMLVLIKSNLCRLKEYLVIIDQALIPLLLNFIKDPSDQANCTKAIRIAIIIIENTSKGMPLILPICNLAEMGNQEWQKISALEAICSICGQTALLKQLYFEDDATLYHKIVQTITKVCNSTFSNIEEVKKPGGKGRIGIDYIRIIADTISRWIESVEVLVEGAGMVLGEPTLLPLTDDQGKIDDILNSTWKAFLLILNIVVTNITDETLLQTVLNCYQNLINISGTLMNTSCRDSFLGSLSMSSMPAGHDQPLNAKQIHICKSLFNIAHCLGSILDVKGWYKVLQTLYRLDSILNNDRIINEDSEIASDMQILSSALESLFLNTHNLSDQSMLDLVNALGQLTLEHLESIAIADKKSSRSSLFALNKMTTTALANINRVQMYWDMMLAHLYCISNSKNPELRVMGITNLSNFLIKVFKHFVENPPSSEQEKWKHWQQTLFISLQDVAGSGYSDTQEAVYNSIFNILQSCGAQLDRTGWGMLLLLLSKADILTHTAICFKCVHIIVSDFLQSEQLLPSLEKLIEVISALAHEANDINVSFSAVGMFWDVADFLGRVGKNEDKLWKMIIEQIKVLGEDSRPEVRHSAIQSLHTALNTHGSCLSIDIWNYAIGDVVFHLLSRIAQTYFQNATTHAEVPVFDQGQYFEHPQEDSSKKPGKLGLQIEIPSDLAVPIIKETPKFAGVTETTFKGDKILVHHSRDTLEKQWEETYNIYIQGLGKLFRNYLINLQSKLETDILEEMTVKKSWEIFILRLKEAIHKGSSDIIISVLKAVKEVLSSELSQSLFYSKWKSSWQLFTTLSHRLQVSNTSIPHKLIVIILEDLHLIYGSKYEDPLSHTCLEELFSLLNFMIFSCKYNQSGITHSKLLSEEKEIFDFVEELAQHLTSVALNAYLRFLLDFCIYNVHDPHSDAICRKGLSILQAIKTTCKNEL